MDTSLTISIIGTIVTIVATLVTIYYSTAAKKYKSEILEEMNRVNLIGVSETLRVAQNETRKLLFPDSPVSRGIKKEEIISNIQKNIDDSLALVSLDTKDKILRQRIIYSQQILRNYTQSLGGTEKENISEFHKVLQDCISIAKTNANNILGK